MLREEAQREADRRNREDPDRERYEFYAFDESAGLAPDAWDVAARLRQGPRADRPATAAAAGRRRRGEHPPSAQVYAEPEHAEPGLADPGLGEPEHAEPGLAEPGLGEPEHAEPGLAEPEHAEPGLAAFEHAEPHAGAPAYGEGAEAWPDHAGSRQAADDRERPGLFVRSIGAAVIVAGMLWMAMVVALAVILRPDDTTSLGVHLGAAALGLAAIALGVAIRRS